MTGPPIAGSHADADGREAAVVAFVAKHLGCQVTAVQRVHAFATNAVYKVVAGGHQLVVKASGLHDALRGEVWACRQGRIAGCPAPPVRGFGRLADGAGMSAFIMSLVDGSSLTGPHPVLREVGVRLRQLHKVRVPGFGCLSDASWDVTGSPLLRSDSWRGFLDGIAGEVRVLVGSYTVAGVVADAVAAAVGARGEAFAAVELGSLCHGDLKLGHVLVDGDRLAGIIDWGDAVVGDPVWDVARFAHRADASSLSMLLEGYDPDRVLVDDLAWRVPLYGALWQLVDAIVDHRLGSRVGGSLLAAMESLTGARQSEEA